jgi:protein kinase/serine/threonine-protein kinase
MALKSFIEQLRIRNIRKTLTIYMSAALTAIGVVKLFTEVYGLPTQIFVVAVTMLTAGVASAFLYAWQKGGQTTPKSRRAGFLFHCCFLTIGIVLSYRVATTPGPIQIPKGSSSIVAVLPFSNLSNSEEDEYFSDGMTEDILTQLSKISGLRVISRTSVMQYKNTTKPLREIGQELGAGSILEGSVRRAGNRVRIVSQLIDAQSDEHIWAETYDREMKDVFDIQGEVARAIAAALKSALSPNENALLDKKPTENFEAYTLYLKGRQHYYLYTDADNDSAIVYFRRALEMDRGYALAYAGLGDAFGQRVEKHGYDPAWLDSALAMCDRALALDSELAEPYKGRGVVYFVRGQLRQAMAEYRSAVEINPNYAPAVANLGSIYWWTGQYDKALPWLLKNVQLSPRASAYQALALLYHGLEEDSLAEIWFRSALQLQPNFTRAGASLIRTFLTLQQPDRAEVLANQLLQQYPSDRFVLAARGDVALYEDSLEAAYDYYERADGTDMEQAFVLRKTGKTEKADSILLGIMETDLSQIKGGSEEFTPFHELARIEALRGNKGEALVWMEKAVAAGWLYYRHSLADPFLENIRDDPAFILLMAETAERVRSMRESAKESRN